MLNIGELVEATNGILVNGDVNLIPKNYVIDSRLIDKDDFFVPIVGENVDGHKFIEDCVNKGITGYFICSKVENKQDIIDKSLKFNNKLCIIEVEDTEKALYNAGKYNREKHLDIPLIAITGSVGKTSTREMIASVLRTSKNVLVTEKNYNSCIGIPIMALKIDMQDICIFEAGIDKFNEMDLESALLKPDIAVITNIGTAHIGTFKDKKNTFKEKLKIVNNLKGINKLIVNYDDKILKSINNNSKYEVLKCSLGEAENINWCEDKITFSTKIYNKLESVTINQIGVHNITNSLYAIKIGEIFNISTPNILKGIASYKNFNRRLQKYIIRNNIVLIDDTYNASIDSMFSGLSTINSMKSKRKIAVLGDMFDLGEYSNKLHEDVGKAFSKFNYDILFTLGEASKNITNIAKEYVENVKCFDTKIELINELNKVMEDGDIVYFKASNGMRFNEIIEELKK